MENMNPGSSIKDRVALKIIEDAEKSGELNRGSTIVEATAGNTGLGLALIAKLKGYKAKVVILKIRFRFFQCVLYISEDRHAPSLKVHVASFLECR